ncbi:MAG: PspA/IM30 family protein [Armatimonadetes bacterium]|nr:PspA/IM30 family protein [Armatimonadota bacterium]
MFGRIWRYLKVLLGFKLDQLEDPEILLQQAQQEMRENQAKNRERAVQAITQKNQLQGELEKTQKIVDNYQAKAELALKNGDRDLARQLLVEKGQYETTLATIKQSLQSAIETTEAIKTAIRREEERIRAKTAQAMAMRTQWKQSQIEISLNKALEGMTTDGTDHAFERAAAKISNARSESQARTELARESLSGKLAGLEDVEANTAADAELAQMEQRLGLAPKTQTTATTSATPASASDVDRQLQELEARVGGGGNSGASGS